MKTWLLLLIGVSLSVAYGDPPGKSTPAELADALGKKFCGVKPIIPNEPRDPEECDTFWLVRMMIQDPKNPCYWKFKETRTATVGDADRPAEPVVKPIARKKPISGEEFCSAESDLFSPACKGPKPIPHELPTPVAPKAAGDPPEKSHTDLDGGPDSEARVTDDTGERHHVGCGKEIALQQRLQPDKKTLLPFAFYELSMRVQNGKWVPAKDTDPDKQCVPVLTDAQGEIRGRVVNTGTVAGKRFRTRLYGFQLGIERTSAANQKYDAIQVGDKTQWLAAGCKEQQQGDEPYLVFIQTAPARDDMQAMGLKFTGDTTVAETFKGKKPFGQIEELSASEVIAQLNQAPGKRVASRRAAPEIQTPVLLTD